jgi:hypothetical protein
MASLALMTGSASSGQVLSDSPYRPNVDRGRVALLEAATAMQTEISLSIRASDPLIGEASHEFELLRTEIGDSTGELITVRADEALHEMISLLDGKRDLLVEVAELLIRRGEVSLEQIAEVLRIPRDATSAKSLATA